MRPDELKLSPNQPILIAGHYEDDTDLSEHFFLFPLSPERLRGWLTKARSLPAAHGETIETKFPVYEFKSADLSLLAPTLGEYTAVETFNDNALEPDIYAGTFQYLDSVDVLRPTEITIEAISQGLPMVSLNTESYLGELSMLSYLFYMSSESGAREAFKELVELFPATVLGRVERGDKMFGEVASRQTSDYINPEHWLTLLRHESRTIRSSAALLSPKHLSKSSPSLRPR